MADRDPSGSITISKRAIRWSLLVVVLVLLVGGGAYALGRHSSSPSSGSTTPATTRTFTIPSGAMEPTLKIGDRVTVQSLGSGESLNRGAIIVFSRPPAENCGGPAVNDLVKRVIGLPGETISLSGGYVYINGKRLNETWLPAPEQGITVAGPGGNNANLTHAYSVPAGHYYLLGDNRTDSCDSRYWGPIDASLVVGKVVQIKGP
jgi:signal peptidase I